MFGLAAEQPFDRSTVNGHAKAAWAAENQRRGTEAKRHGVERPTRSPIRLHESRHTCPSTFLVAGGNPKVIQRIMGHATIHMTFDQDGHLFPGGLEEAAATANAYLVASAAVV